MRKIVTRKISRRLSLVFMIVLFMVSTPQLVYAVDHKEEPIIKEGQKLNESALVDISNIKVIRVITSPLDVSRINDRDTVEKALKALGFRVVDANARDYDATLRVEIRRVPWKARYWDERYHYSGVSISGSIRFIFKGKTLYSYPINENKAPPSKISRSYPGPEYAPFGVYGDRRLSCDIYYVLGCLGRIHSIINSLESESWIIREAAAIALGKIGEPKAIESLMKLLGDENSIVQTKAIEALGEIGDPKVIERLIEALNIVPNPARPAIIKALGNIGKPAVEPLIEALGDKNSYWLRDGAVQSLGKIDDPRTIKPLIEVLSCGDVPLQCKAAKALGEIGDPKAIEGLIEALRDEHFTRMAAAKALSEIGKPAVRSLIKALDDMKGDARAYAAEALGEIGDPRAVKPLIEILFDEDPFVRLKVADALGQIGNEFAVPALRKALNDEFVSVRKSAKEALEKIEVEKRK